MNVHTSEQAVTTRGGVSADDVLVLLWADAEDRASRQDLDEIASWLSAHDENLRVAVKDGPGPISQDVKSALEQSKAHRLVLGFYSSAWPETEVQAVVRRAGLDPLGIQAVCIGSCRDGAGSPASARARLLLAAAIAHARAFRGSRPENLKARLASGQQRISRRALFTLPPITYAPVPTISAESCAAGGQCSQCVSACPSGALRRMDNTIVVDRSKCQSCAVCVEACPQRAVEFPGWSAEEFEAHLSALLRTNAGVAERSILFVCSHDRAPAGGEWLSVRVPCVAMVPTAAILRSLAQGATAVGVRPCGPECPAGADDVVRGRVSYCQDLLRALGDSPERVVMGDAPPAVASRASPTTRPEGAAPALPPRLFGTGAAADAVEALAACYPQASAVLLEHPSSPLGIVSINAGACTGCEACAHACPTGALSFRREGEDISLSFDPRMCVACECCLPVCPEKSAGAIRLTRVTSAEEIRKGARVAFCDQEVRCAKCGAPVASRRMLTRIADILGQENGLRRMEGLCPECRGLPV